MVNTLYLWNEGNDDQGVVVAILDTGIAAHPWFSMTCNWKS